MDNQPDQNLIEYYAQRGIEYIEQWHSDGHHSDLADNQDPLTILIQMEEVSNEE